MMVKRSDCGRAWDIEADMSHDSKAEKRMEVGIPLRTRPTSRTGRKGTRMQRHAQV
jgi:hypothetical protein